MNFDRTEVLIFDRDEPLRHLWQAFKWPSSRKTGRRSVPGSIASPERVRVLVTDDKAVSPNFVYFRQRFYQLENPLPDTGAFNLVVGSNQFQCFPPGERVLFPSRGRMGGIDGEANPPILDFVWYFFEKIGDGNVQNTAQVVHPAGADPVRPSLVFLNLLKRQTDRLTQPFLAKSEEGATQSDATPDMDINWVWHAGGSATRVGRWCFREPRRLVWLFRFTHHELPVP